MTDREIDEKVNAIRKTIGRHHEVVDEIRLKRKATYESVKDMAKADFYATKRAMEAITSFTKEIDSNLNTIKAHERNIKKLLNIEDDTTEKILEWKQK